MSEKRFFTILADDEYTLIQEKGNLRATYLKYSEVVDLLNEQQAKIHQQEEIIKSQDMEISRQYNLCLAMSGILREEFGVYDVFDRSKDKRVK